MFGSQLRIQDIIAREILDSRGNPTLETRVTLRNQLSATASVPSGASTGKYECLELRDHDSKRFHGLGVIKAIRNVNTKIKTMLVGKKAEDLRAIDSLMIDCDATDRKTKLGANAMLSVSLAITRAMALTSGEPLYAYLRKNFFSNETKYRMPQCMMNIINGGAHANWTTDFQEYLILPRFQTAKKQIRAGSEIFFTLKKMLQEKRLPIGVGDEGGFSMESPDNEKPLEQILEAIQAAGYQPEKNIMLGLDIASSEFYSQKMYRLKKSDQIFHSIDFITYISNLAQKYPILTIEDGCTEDDWQGWHVLTQKLGKKIHLIGDDLFTTNQKRLNKGIEKKCGNAILIKPNQIGTVSETINTILLAKKHGFACAISHRSGETSDDFIADLCVASNAEYFKAGSLSRGERIAKYNRLTKIEDEIEARA